MKFTKEQSFEQIKAILGQTKLTSDRSINEKLDTLISIIASEEMELGEFVEKVKPMFLTDEANIKHNNSEFAKNYKPPTPTPTPEPEPTPTPTPTGGVTPEQIAEIVKQANAPFIEELQAIKAKASREQLLGQVDGIISSWNVSPKRTKLLTMAKDMSFGNIASDATAETLATMVKTNFDNLLNASSIEDGYIPDGGTGGGDTNSELKATLQAIEAKEQSGGNNIMSFMGLNQKN